jgi:hypothetical protein
MFLVSEVPTLWNSLPLAANFPKAPCARLISLIA